MKKISQFLSTAVLSAMLFSPMAFNMFYSMMQCEGVPAICGG